MSGICTTIILFAYYVEFTQDNLCYDGLNHVSRTGYEQGNKKLIDDTVILISPTYFVFTHAEEYFFILKIITSLDIHHRIRYARVLRLILL